MIEKIKKQKVNIVYYIFLMFLTAGIGYLSLGKGFDFEIYDGFGGDGIFGMAIVKSIQENGFSGIWFNSRIGAPETAALIDYPVLGNVMVLLLWIISWFIKSTPAIMYIYLILTFVLDGLSMSFLLRKLGIRRVTAFVISALFSFAPHHFYRYLGHSSLINYMFVPIAIYLALYVIEYFDEKKWKIALLAILLGLGYGYYYAFGLILIAVAYFMRFVLIQEKKNIIKELWVIGIVLLTVLISLTPKSIYTLINGNNLEAGIRSWSEQEIYGLKIINLLLPVTYSRVGFLKSLTDEYVSKAQLVTENVYASMGIIASIGFVVLCIAFIISFIGKKRPNEDGREWRLIDYLAFSTITFLLCSTIGGFGEIFNWAVTSQIRCWNRSSIVLTALALIMMAVLMNKVESRKKNMSYVVCSVVLVIGLYDQVMICSANWQAGARQTQEVYEEYFEKVEANLPEKGMVYQLPFLNFPEAGAINNVGDYKLFAGYLFTDKLRWSYGGVRGRNNAARELNIDNGMSYLFLKGIREAGFDAVYIDLDGYGDGGVQILSFYDSLGVEPIVSADAKLYTYDISQIEISEGWNIPGYAFVKQWAALYSENLGEESLIQLVKGLNGRDVNTYLTMYQWCIASDASLQYISDDEYVDFIYDVFLDREPDENGRDSWTHALKSGISRQDVFCSFLEGDEFRNKYGLLEDD